MEQQQKARALVTALFQDMSGRKGFDTGDVDDESLQGWQEDWVNIVLPHVSAQPEVNHHGPRTLKDPDDIAAFRKRVYLTMLAEAGTVGSATAASNAQGLWNLYRDVCDYERNGGEPG